MKRFIAFLAFALMLSPLAFAGRRSSVGYKSSGYGYSNSRSTAVRGSVNRKTGTYKAPYRRTVPNSTQKDNYSTKGNQNPWTGKRGTKGADK